MVNEWIFNPSGPDPSGLSQPQPLTLKGMGLPKDPGVYIVTCGACLAHVGTSGRLADRVGTLARLGAHQGSGEVLCAAYCTGQPPLVRWQILSPADARLREKEFKRFYREPPQPEDKYRGCKSAQRLRNELLGATGPDSWQAGYIEAVFDIGNCFSQLLESRFESLWQQVGYPPGPWAPAR